MHKWQELERRAGQPPSGQKPQRPVGALAVLAKLVMALAIGAGVALLVGGGIGVYGSVTAGVDSRVSDYGVFLGCGIGLIVFGTTAFGWLFGQPQKKLGKGQLDVHVSQTETPLSRSGLTQDNGLWPPQSELVGSGETHEPDAASGRSDRSGASRRRLPVRGAGPGS
jgi:hypothetical protein